MTDDYKKGYQDGFKDGYNKAKNQYTPPVDYISKCPVCHLEMTNLLGLVCYNFNCPSKITCLSTGE